MLAAQTQPSLFPDAAAPPSPAPRPRPDRVGETDVAYDHAREILTRATGFMDAYDFTLNPYSGCSFGCSYCYAAFFTRTKTARDDWGKWVAVKETPPRSWRAANPAP